MDIFIALFQVTGPFLLGAGQREDQWLNFRWVKYDIPSGKLTVGPCKSPIFRGN
jgi:hypothetical protein